MVYTVQCPDWEVSELHKPPGGKGPICKEEVQVEMKGSGGLTELNPRHWTYKHLLSFFFKVYALLQHPAFPKNLQVLLYDRTGHASQSNRSRPCSSNIPAKNFYTYISLPLLPLEPISLWRTYYTDFECWKIYSESSLTAWYIVQIFCIPVDRNVVPFTFLLPKVHSCMIYIWYNTIKGM